MIASNLPDIDSFIAPLWGEPSIVAHRGFTHGIGGLLVLPFFTAAMILAWEKFRPNKNQVPVRFRPLILIAFIGGFFHSLYDWLTSYGTRLLEPFSHRWFYGDTLFIVDPWIWIALIVGLELSWRAERLGRNWTRPAGAMFAAVLAYIGLNAAISVTAVAASRPLIARIEQPRMIVAGEVPLLFWERQVMWRGSKLSGTVRYSAFSGATLDPQIVPLNLDDPRLAAAARSDPDVCNFLFWSRMPLVVEQDGKAYLSDQRFPALRSVTFLLPLDKR